MIECIGCKGLSPAQCNRKGFDKSFESKLLAVHGRSSGCVASQKTKDRLNQIGQKCAKKMFDSAGREKCGSFNLMAGLVTAHALTPNDDAPVDIEIPKVSDVPLSFDNNEAENVKKWTAPTAYVCSASDWQMKQVPKLTDASQAPQLLTEHRIAVPWNAFSKSSDVSPHKLQMFMATTANMMNTAIAEGTFLLSSGLCKANKKPVNAKQFLQMAFQPILEGIAGVEGGKFTEHFMKMFSGAGLLHKTDPMKHRWPAMSGEKNEFDEGNQPLYCKEKSHSEWFQSIQKRSVTEDGKEDATKTWKEAFGVPCVWEDDSLTMAVLQNFLQPISTHWDDSDKTFSKAVVGDSGAADSLIF